MDKYRAFRIYLLYEYRSRKARILGWWPLSASELATPGSESAVACLTPHATCARVLRVVLVVALVHRHHAATSLRARPGDGCRFPRIYRPRAPEGLLEGRGQAVECFLTLLCWQRMSHVAFIVAVFAKWLV